MTPFNLVVTHSGHFHADEVLAVAISTLPGLDNQIVTREKGKPWFKRIGRKPHEYLKAFLDDPDCLVLDVGGQWSPVKGNFDHHQGKLLREGTKMPYATAGLLWNSFGVEICHTYLLKNRKELARLRESYSTPGKVLFTTELAHKIAENVDENFITIFDAHDAAEALNVSAYAGSLRFPYHESSLPVVVSRMNQPDDDPSDTGAFLRAVDYLTKALEGAIEAAIKIEVTGLVFDNLLSDFNRASYDDSTCVFYFGEEERVDWRHDMGWVMAVRESYPHANGVVYKGKDGDWRVESLPVSAYDRTPKIKWQKPEKFPHGFLHPSGFLYASTNKAHVDLVIRHTCKEEGFDV